MRRMSLSAKILVGMGLGIFVGLFFGEDAAVVHIFGEAFVQLLQVSILPFVALSLITGLGRLTYDEALSIAKSAGAVLLVLWIIAIATVAAIPFAFPDWESASFFSTSLVEEKKEIDFLRLYIPSNPYYSFANSIVPAVVVFSILVGVALIGIERKQGLLDVLSVALDAMSRITGFIVQLAPYGVFAIAASAAGTMDPDDLGRLQVYSVTFIAVALVLTFWVLPALVANLTSLSYKDVVRTVRSALITAFATGNHMIILPILTYQGRELLRQAELGGEETDSAVEVIVPTSFTFPTIGMLLSLSFVPFAGWFVGSPLSLTQYPTFLVSGLASFFGGAVVAMPFLLDLFRIPADMFQLFVTVDVFTGRFGALLAAMHIWVLALLGTCAMVGRLRVRWTKLVPYLGISAGLMLAVLVGSRLFFTYAVDPEYTKYKQFVEMELRYEPLKATIYDESQPPRGFYGSGKSRLETVRERGTLRVGYYKDSLPFAFTNAANHLVGFDVEMAHLLAKDLRVGLEFVLLELKKEEHEALNEGLCDVIMSGTAMSPGRSERMAFSDPHMDATIAFIVKDHRRDDFTTWEAAQRLTAPRIGIPTHSRYYLALAESLLPKAKIVPLDSPRDFFRNSAGDLDALLYAAEPGSAWTLVYPRYTIAVPMPDPIVIPLSYPMPQGERSLVDFVNTWLKLKQKDGTIRAVFRHWILGQGAERKEPRWSIVRNVLGWVE